MHQHRTLGRIEGSQTDRGLLRPCAHRDVGEAAPVGKELREPVYRFGARRVSHSALPTDPIVTALLLDALGTTGWSKPSTCPG